MDANTPRRTYKEPTTQYTSIYILYRINKVAHIHQVDGTNAFCKINFFWIASDITTKEYKLFDIAPTSIWFLSRYMMSLATESRQPIGQCTKENQLHKPCSSSKNIHDALRITGQPASSALPVSAQYWTTTGRHAMAYSRVSDSDPFGIHHYTSYTHSHRHFHQSLK